MATEHHSELRTRILLDQLNQARGALGHSRRMLARSMSWGSICLLILLVLGYTKWLPMAALALPFAVIFLVVQYAYYTHLVTYGRACVAELENKINTDLGETLLISESLEAKKSGPLGAAHFLGITGSNLTSLFNIMPLHYLILCVALFIAGVLRTQFILKQPELRPVERFGDLYAPLLLIWALIHIIYLIWYFVQGEEERNLLAAIRKQYQPKSE
jgi:hypothetical protein